MVNRTLQLNQINNMINKNRESEAKAILALYKKGDCVTYKKGGNILPVLITRVPSAFTCRGFDTQFEVINPASGKQYCIRLFDIMNAEGIA